MSHIFAFASLLAPLLSFITVCLVAGKRQRTISFLAVFWMSIGLVSTIALFVTAWHRPFVIPLAWFDLGSTTFTADLAISDKSLMLLTTAAFISLLVHLYSLVYMKEDEDRKRYFAMLGFFTFSMQGIVLSDNLLFLFIFWELVGFSSWMLIGHWTNKPEAGRAASKAFIMNRIGDAGFLIGLMILWTAHGTFSLSAILDAPHHSTWQTAASLCIFCGIIGKSAQFPLFTWLPDAMEGPTPVSALIHAATMVAAGVYLLVRTFALFTPDALLVVAITGIVTTLAGALAALSQYDIKKILAYSTMSQLGLMILALGMGAADAALLHLLTHAFFKACLFLGAGIVIHALHRVQRSDMHFDPQDIRNMGGLRKYLPVTFLAFIASGASLAGIPFFSGFLSKEAILNSLLMQATSWSWIAIAVVITVSLLTVLYTFRLIWFVFLGKAGNAGIPALKEPEWAMRIPVVLLAACSLWLSVSWNPFDFQGWMTTTRQSTDYAHWLTTLSVLWVVAALALGWLIFRNKNIRTTRILRNAFYVDRFYEGATAGMVRTSSRAVSFVESRVIDRGLHAMTYLYVILAHIVAWIDRTFIDGTVNTTARLVGVGGKITRSLQGGNIQLYIFWSVFAIIIFIIWVLGISH